MKKLGPLNINSMSFQPPLGDMDACFIKCPPLTDANSDPTISAFDESLPKTRVLLAIVQNKSGAIITHNIFYKLFTKFGQVDKILIFEKKSQLWKAFIEMHTIESAEAAKKGLNNTQFLDDGSNMIVHHSSLKLINLQNQQSGGVDYQQLRQSNQSCCLSSDAGTNIEQKKKARSSIISTDSSRQDFISSASTFAYDENNGKDIFLREILKNDNEPFKFFCSSYPSKDEFFVENNNNNQQVNQDSLSKQLSLQMSQDQDSGKNFQQIFSPININKKAPLNQGSATNNSKTSINAISTPVQQDYKFDFNFLESEDNIDRESSSNCQQEEDKEITKEQILQKIESCTNQCLNKKMQSSISNIPDLILNKKKPKLSVASDQTSEQSYQFDPSNYVNPQFINENLRSKVIYVRGIKSMEVKAKHLYNIFSNFGNIIKIIIIRKKMSALVEFEQQDYATQAKDQLNNQFLLGQQLKVFYSHHQQLECKSLCSEGINEQQNQEDIFFGSHDNFRFNKVKNIKINPPSQILHLSNISSDIFFVDTITQLFVPYGKVESVKLSPSMVDCNKNMGFVKMSSIEQSLIAVAFLHGKVICGKELHLSFTTTKI